MAGLREQQKQQRRQAIAESAARLFSEKGFQATRIEEIAADAGVSVPTLFKYFPSKQAILFGMMQIDEENVVERCLQTMDFSHDTVDILCDLEAAVTAEEFSIIPPPLWRELMPLILFHPKDELPVHYQENNARFVQSLERFLKTMQEHGHFATGADLTTTAYILNDYAHLQLIRLTAQDPMDWEKHKRDVRHSTELVVNGLKPR